MTRTMHSAKKTTTVAEPQAKKSAQPRLIDSKPPQANTIATKRDLIVTAALGLLENGMHPQDHASLAIKARDDVRLLCSRNGIIVRGLRAIWDEGCRQQVA